LYYIIAYSDNLCCSVDSQGKGKVWRFAGLVQHWAFMAFQLAIG